MILRDGLILESDDADDNDDEPALAQPGVEPSVVEPIAESIPIPIKIITEIIPEMIHKIVPEFIPEILQEPIGQPSIEPLPVETPEQEARRKIIQMRIDQSNRQAAKVIKDRAFFDAKKSGAFVPKPVVVVEPTARIQDSLASSSHQSAHALPGLPLLHNRNNSNDASRTCSNSPAQIIVLLAVLGLVLVLVFVG